MISVINFVVGTVAIATVTLGCSPPEGGYVEPTAAEKIHYSDHMIVGKVLSIIIPDPVFGDMYQDKTYGAKVQVRCTYKGGVLGDSISIHGAGVIPGMCTAKPLSVGQTLILFLDKENNTKTYEQVYPGEVYSQNIQQYRDVCGLNMQYPRENGITLPREVCEEPFKKADCKRYNPNGNTNSVGTKSMGAASDPQPDNVVVKFANKNDTSTTVEPDNSTPAVSVSMVLLALCSILRQMV